MVIAINSSSKDFTKGEKKKFPMESKSGAATKSSPGEFEPISEWRKEGGRDILVLQVLDFKKDQMKVKFTPGVLIITGERPATETKPNRFKKQINISKDIKPEDIRAKHVVNRLEISMPSVPTKQEPPSKVQPPQDTSQDKKSQDKKTEKQTEKREVDEPMGNAGNKVATSSEGASPPVSSAKFKLGLKNSLKWDYKVAAKVAVVVVVGAMGSYGAYALYKLYRSSNSQN